MAHRWVALARVIAGLVVLVGLAVEAITRLPGISADLSRTRAYYRDHQVVAGVPMTGPLDAADAEFLAAVDRIVPATAVIYLNVGGGTACGNEGLVRFYVLYALLPRAAVCDETTPRWLVVVRDHGFQVPSGASVLASASGDALVRVNGP